MINMIAKLNRYVNNLHKQVEDTSRKNRLLRLENEQLKTLLSTRARLDKALPEDEQKYINDVMDGKIEYT